MRAHRAIAVAALVPAFLLYRIARPAWRPDQSNRVSREPARAAREVSLVGARGAGTHSYGSQAADTVAGAAGTRDAATVPAATKPLLPSTKRECQSLLRALGYTGMKIDKIDTDRVFCLTGKKLQPDGQMRRQPMTIVVEPGASGIDHVCYQGWIC